MYLGKIVMCLLDPFFCDSFFLKVQPSILAALIILNFEFCFSNSVRLLQALTYSLLLYTSTLWQTSAIPKEVVWHLITEFTALLHFHFPGDLVPYVQFVLFCNVLKKKQPLKYLFRFLVVIVLGWVWQRSHCLIATATIARNDIPTLMIFLLILNFITSAFLRFLSLFFFLLVNLKAFLICLHSFLCIF